MTQALNGKNWLEQFRYYADPACNCSIEELREAYLQMTMNYINELVNSRQLEDFVSDNYGEEQIEKLAVEGALSNRLIRILCQNPEDLAAQTEAAAKFVEFNLYK